MDKDKLPQSNEPVKKKRDNNEAFRLAKKIKGLARAEKAALIAIADTSSMAEAQCRKSTSRISDEYGTPDRTFRYGVRGRNRKDGSEYFPGLLRRGLVELVSGGSPKSGVPTVYRIRMEALKALCGTSAQTSAQASAQNDAILGTSEAEPRHNSTETSAQWPTSSRESSEKHSSDNQPPQRWLPEWVPADLWNAFLDERTAMHKKPTIHAQKLLLKKLARLYSESKDIRQVIEQTIARGWTDFSPVVDPQPPDAIDEYATEEAWHNDYQEPTDDERISEYCRKRKKLLERNSTFGVNNLDKSFELGFPELWERISKT